MSYMPDSDSEDELPPEWEERSFGGYVCYYNEKENIKQWTHPRTGCRKRIETELPFGWEQKIDPHTKWTIFINPQTKQETYIDPRLIFAYPEPVVAGAIRQRFDCSSTALQVLHGKDLTGRLAIVTGANSGIGLETARSLLLHGCCVVFACRNIKTTEEVIARLTSEIPLAQKRSKIIQLDLASIESVDNFISTLDDCGDLIMEGHARRHIDYLILNAGVFGLPYTITKDGLETTFQVSHLSHFHLTLELESKKWLDYRSRIIVVSSESHRYANLPADGLTEQHLSPSQSKYWSMLAYNNAKLCNVLFAQELAHRWKDRGISVFSLHPGNMISTQLQRNWWFYRLLFAIIRPFTKSLQQGAATTIYCATANELTGLTGHYFNNCYFCEPSSLSKSVTLRRQLWQISEEMISKIKKSLHTNHLR